MRRKVYRITLHPSLIDTIIDMYTPTKSLREGVCNSYDAYATSVSLTCDEKKIIIEDNGTGITHGQIVKYFLPKGSTHKLRMENIPPPWYKGEKREIIGRFGIGVLSFFKFKNSFTFRAKCAEEDKVREYVFHRSKGRLPWTFEPDLLDPEGFNEHGTTILVEEPDIKVKEWRVRNYLSEALFPLFSHDFEIFLNNAKVEPKTWPDGKKYSVNEERGYGKIQGKIIDIGEPYASKDGGYLFLYNKGVLICKYPISTYSHVTGYLNENFLDLMPDRDDYKENKKWRIFENFIVDFLKQKVKPYESKPTKTNPEVIKQAVKIVRKAMREEIRHHKKKRKTQHGIKSGHVEGIGVRGVNLFRIGNWNLYVDSMGSDEGPVMCDRSKKLIILNDANYLCEAIRKTYPEKLQPVHYAHLISVGLTFGQDLNKGWEYERYYHERLNRIWSSTLLRYLHRRIRKRS